MPKLGLGVDIGSSGVEGAVVDLAVGGLATERYKVLTPRPSTPGAVADVVAEVVGQFGWEGPIGCTFPAVVRDGVALTAANVDSAWIGTNIESVVGSATGLPVVAVNDADAAGIAEARWGAGKDAKGLVIVVTLGTGIGTALFYNGALIPNSELGHLELDGNDYEQKASAGARGPRGSVPGTSRPASSVIFCPPSRRFCGPTFSSWAGVSRRAEKFLPMVTLNTPIVPATLQNEAGIAGAAYLSAQAK